jgi:ABC-type dipeptide/oligopeptide/nickel transport system ATPase component
MSCGCDLLVYYDTPVGAVTAVNHVSFNLKVGSALAWLGNLAQASPRWRYPSCACSNPLAGRRRQVWLDGVNLMTLSEADMRQVRLARIALIPQGR